MLKSKIEKILTYILEKFQNQMLFYYSKIKYNFLINLAYKLIIIILNIIILVSLFKNINDIKFYIIY